MTEKDLHDSLSEVVDSDPQELAGSTAVGDTGLGTSDEMIDRSTILAHDAKSIAGWALRFIIVAVAAFILWHLLGYIWVGLLPAMLALIFATVLWPAVRFLRNRKIPAALAVLLVIVGFFGIIFGIFAAMAPTIARQSKDLAVQAEAGIEQILRYLETGPIKIDTTQIDKAISELQDFVSGQASNIASGVMSGVSAATSIATTVVLMLVLVFFFLKDGDGFLPWVRKYVGEKAGFHITEVSMRSWNTLAGFIRTQALVSFVDAFFIGIGLVILQIPLALALAVITFFAGFIPIIGAFSAGALAVIIALVSQGFTSAVIVLVLIIAVQQIEGNVLQPLLQSKAMGLHAAIVLLSVAVGSTLFGILGAFLAVPVAAVAAVWLRYHAEMVSLRSGEITADDIQLSTQRGSTLSSQEAFNAVREHLRSMGRRKAKAPAEEETAEATN
ncbi:AI-2E family transporter [Corynebacterium breve]|uniref:AI-2E family transporter n=1 Tax=Corynebacterium breve TaxID=3049799 RepID=A0ABY8VCT1_9CORY|nr:AI-2E family transporter [Corynebacterium breve]WIM67456.1 AI-2E family transporter [Corynebacterium breve]